MFVGPLCENDAEVKANKWSGHASTNDTRDYFPDPERFSSWTRYRRVVAWICRFFQNCKSKAADRILVAIRKSQIDSFHLDIEALNADKRLPVKSRLDALRPYIDEEHLLRVGGRLWKAPVPNEARHPLILDLKDQVTHLIVMYHHLRLYCTNNKHL